MKSITGYLKTQVAERYEKKLNLLMPVLTVILAILPFYWFILKHKNYIGNEKNTNVNVKAAHNLKTTTYTELISQSAFYLNKKEPNKAMPLILKAIQMDRGKSEAYNNLGICYIYLGNAEAAIRCITQAIKLEPQKQLYKNNLNWAKSLKQTISVTRVKKMKTVEDYIDSGFVLYNKNEFEKCRLISATGLSKFPGNIKLLNNIGSAEILLKRYDDAITHFQTAIKIDKNDKLSFNNLQWAITEKIKNKK